MIYFSLYRIHPLPLLVAVPLLREHPYGQRTVLGPRINWACKGLIPQCSSPPRGRRINDTIIQKPINNVGILNSSSNNNYTSNTTNISLTNTTDHKSRLIWKVSSTIIQQLLSCKRT
jgi:hypothetical protein